MIRFHTLDESKSTEFASMDDVVSFKVYTYDVLGMTIYPVYYLNEIGVETDTQFGTYNNKITNDNTEYGKGILNAAEIVKGLSRLPADIPEVMRQMVDLLVKFCMEVINTDEDVYLA